MLNLATPIAPAIIDFAWVFGYTFFQFFIIIRFLFDMLTSTSPQQHWDALWTLVSHQSYIVIGRILIDIMMSILRIPKLMEKNIELLEELRCTAEEDERSETDSESSMPSLEATDTDEDTKVDDDEEKKKMLREAMDTLKRLRLRSPSLKHRTK